MADHADVSGFQNTSAEEDEGQHLQSVYRPAKAYGGPGRFARRGGAHLTEGSKPEASLAATQFMSQWSPYWDLDKPLLVEKSPPNMLMGRWLQAAFPGSALIVIVRHPVVVALSTKKWTRRTSLERLVDHWCIAHSTLENDAPHLRRLLVVRYEELVSAPERTLETVAHFMGLMTPLASDRLEGSRSSRYVDRWSQMAHGTRIERYQHSRIRKVYGRRVARYGYDVDDLNAIAPFQWPPTP